MALPLPTPACVDCGSPADVRDEKGRLLCATCAVREDFMLRGAEVCTCCDALAVVLDEENEPLCAAHAESARQRELSDDSCPGCESGHGFLCAKCQRAAGRS